MLLTSASGVLWQLTGYGHVTAYLVAGPSGPTGPGLMLLAAAALTLGLAAFLALAGHLARTVTMAPLRGRATALRAQSRGNAFGRQRDPDAAGRSRPRAPTGSPAAA